MIEVRNISLAFGEKTLFNDISFVINRGDRIALTGANGAGKSTLLKILMGEDFFESGKILRPKYTTVGYLPQDISELSARSLYEEAESAFESVIETRNRLSEAEEMLKVYPDGSPQYLQTIEDIGELERKLEDLDAYKIRTKVEIVLHGLGFQQEDLSRSCSEFSGGWKMRIALAKLLLLEPSLLMLDEPTNHLDIESITWLEDYLSAYKGALVIVSHDKSFLDLITRKTLHLNFGRLDSYAGNYSYFERESVVRRQLLEKAALNQQRQIAKTERFIERFRAKNTKASQVQSRIKSLEKIERITLDVQQSGIEFNFPPTKRSAQVVAQAENLCKSYGGHQVLKDVCLKIERGEKVALVGVNGAGKSTLVKIMAGELDYNSGEVKLGGNVEMSYFAQHQASELNPENSVLEELESSAPVGEKHKARGLLGSFLFSGDDVFKKVGVLSGGEKNRLALAKMLLRSFNFLILDEPTNHLDINSKDVLRKALKNYDGTFLIVSHDRDFLDGIVSRVIEIGRRGVRSFAGNISYYVEKIKEEGVLDSPHKEKKSQSASAVSWKQQKLLNNARNLEKGKLRRKIEAAEKKIQEVESEMASLEEQMSREDFFKDVEGSKAVMQHYNALKEEIVALYADWESANSELENMLS